jgi:hypothetical protein
MRPALSPKTLDALSRALAGVEGPSAKAPDGPDRERRRKQGEKEERRKPASSGRAH